MLKSKNLEDDVFSLEYLLDLYLDISRSIISKIIPTRETRVSWGGARVIRKERGEEGERKEGHFSRQKFRKEEGVKGTSCTKVSCRPPPFPFPRPLAVRVHFRAARCEHTNSHVLRVAVIKAAETVSGMGETGWGAGGPRHFSSTGVS